MTTETTNNEYASKGVAGSALGIGIGGLALSLLNGGGLLMGNNGFGYNRNNQIAYVSKDEYAAGQQIAAKDAEIALLKSENDSEQKMVSVYTTLATKIENLTAKLNEDNEKILTRTDGQYATLNSKIDTNRNAQDAINMGQVGFNAKIGSDMECVKGKLHDISRYSVPWYDVTKSAINPYSSILSSLT